MRVPSLQTIVVKPELIRIVRRENSRKWQVHYKIEGVKTWFRKSVQTTDVDKAIQLAERMWMKAKHLHSLEPNELLVEIATLLHLLVTEVLVRIPLIMKKVDL